MSDDVYKGFASATGHDEVYDYAGTADKLDLRPMESSDVYLDAFDHDGVPANGDESLRIVVDDATSVSVVGHFSPAIEDDAGNGRIEQLVFADETITGTAEVRSLVRATSEKKGVTASQELLEAPMPKPLPAEAR